MRPVAIIGFASSSRGLAPFGDPNFEIWGMNSIYALIPRMDRLYEMHDPEYLASANLMRGELQQIGVDHMTYLRGVPAPGHEKSFPIVMKEHYPDIPASVPFPREAINAWTTERFGKNVETDYFGSTPAQMLIHAIYEGRQEVHLYGVDLLQQEEYAYQRPNMEYWCGVARGMGIKLHVPKESAILKCNYVYGYVEPPVVGGSLDPLVKFWGDKTEQITKSLTQTQGLLNTVDGARQMSDAVKRLIAEGRTPEQIAEWLAGEDANLTRQREMGRDWIQRLDAQRELAASGASWTSHFGRGGVLEGM